MALGEELLKDRQYRDVEELTVRHGTVHFRDVRARAARRAVGPGRRGGGCRTPRVRAGELVVVYRRDVRRALHVLQPAGLLPQLRLAGDVAVALARAPRGRAVRTLGDRVRVSRARGPTGLGAPGAATFVARALRHRALDYARHRLLVFF